MRTQQLLNWKCASKCITSVVMRIFHLQSEATDFLTYVCVNFVMYFGTVHYDIHVRNNNQQKCTLFFNNDLIQLYCL